MFLEIRLCGKHFWKELGVKVSNRRFATQLFSSLWFIVLSLILIRSSVVFPWISTQNVLVHTIILVFIVILYHFAVHFVYFLLDFVCEVIIIKFLETLQNHQFFFLFICQIIKVVISNCLAYFSSWCFVHTLLIKLVHPLISCLIQVFVLFNVN